jgi:hypothetical protein
VQVMSAVGPMKATGHDKTYGTGSIVPALAKSARTGHPLFRNGKGKHKGPGHPPDRLRREDSCNPKLGIKVLGSPSCPDLGYNGSP